MSKFRVTAKMFAKKREMFPELARAVKSPRSVARTRTGRALLRRLRPLLEDLRSIPGTPYSLYRQYHRNGNRRRFEKPYFLKRQRLVAAAAMHFLEPDPELLDVVQDYLWDTCEETTWILPAHERGGMDLFSTETAFCLAETVHLLRDQLAAEVIERVNHEIRRRIIDPFLSGAGKRRPAWGFHEPNLTDFAAGRQHNGMGWYKGHNNWCGVCNGSVGAALLYCETDSRRLARGVNLVLDGLTSFLRRAFCADGASDEGASYWQYGLINFVAFAELLRNRTGGKVDLLRHPKMKKIASFPLGVYLSPGRFYNHADCPPRIRFTPGVISRLAEKTGVPELRGLLATAPGVGARMPMLLRDLLWWDGSVARAPKAVDRLFPEAGLFRMVSGRVVVAGKAGHNRESHNHNDVGSFIVHAAGEDLLCDPGAPTYTRDFFSDKRYTHFLHTQSRGHNCPVIGGACQEFGERYRGEVKAFRNGGPRHSVELEFARAYPLKSLKSLRRRLDLTPGGQIQLEDSFEFSGRGAPVEEGFVTWLPTSVRGSSATIRGERSTLRLKIAEPRGAKFRIEKFELESKAAPGKKEKNTLRRLVVRLPRGARRRFVLQGKVTAKSS